MVVTVGLTLSFGKSDNLAAAYGIAVSLTMLMTSALLFVAMREVWGWGLLPSSAFAGALLCIDAAFFAANLVKVMDGGYVPLLLAGLVYGVMLIWHRGTAAVSRAVSATQTPIAAFLREIEAKHIPRVPGTAVFLTRTSRDTPPVMNWHLTSSHT
jgi:KUP system potassium uptake protein